VKKTRTVTHRHLVDLTDKEEFAGMREFPEFAADVAKLFGSND
jgi:hypothetical protein